MNETMDVRYEQHGGVAVITLNRPKSLNAFDQDLAAALAAALVRAGSDETVRSVLLRAEGPFFCAGGDVKRFRAWQADSQDDREAAYGALIDAVHGVVERLNALRVPVVAVVQGGASGFGIGLMAACDFVLAADNARFRMAYLDLGAPPDGGTTWWLPRLMGLRRARELILLSEPFAAAEAVRLDLVNRTLPPDQLEAAGLELAQRLAAGPTQAYARVKALLADSGDRSLPQQLAAEQAAFVANTRTADFAEGLTAFGEKRPPRFNGC